LQAHKFFGDEGNYPPASKKKSENMIQKERLSSFSNKKWMTSNSLEVKFINLPENRNTIYKIRGYQI
jgi:hypothetical protein